MNMQRTIPLILAILLSSSYCRAHACAVAVEIAVDNLGYRLLAPHPDLVRIRRAFEQLSAIDRRCSAAKKHISADDCAAMSAVSRELSPLSGSGVAAFKRITGCKLALADQAPTVRATRMRPKKLILQTLREQQESDGEASYWIANDLLALFLVYPDDVLQELELMPSFEKRFISDLGGNALEDLDDRPGSGHFGVQKKTNALGTLLPLLRKRTAPGSTRMRILDEIAKACRCGVPKGNPPGAPAFRH